MDIYVQKDGQRVGPFPEAKIREGIDAGKFAPADLAWTTGKASWQPLSALIDLDVAKPPPIVDEPEPLPSADALKKAPSTPAPPSSRGSSKVFGPLIGAGLLACLFLASHWEDYFPKHISAKELNVLNERQGFQPSQFDPRSRAANVRGNEEAFIALYGKPLKVGHGALPPATDDLLFRHGDLVYLVSFWYGSAHNILVWRWDDKPLTDEDAQAGLAAFSDGEEWTQEKLESNGKQVWRRIGVAAFIEDVRSQVEGATDYIPVNGLRIVTDEFVAAADTKK